MTASTFAMPPAGLATGVIVLVLPLLAWSVACTSNPSVPGEVDAGPRVLEDFSPCETDAECASGDCRRTCVPHECDVDAQCGDDGACVRTSHFGNTCGVPALRGEVCSHDDDTRSQLDVSCAEGLVCELQEAGGFSTDSVCVPPEGTRLVNEPCDEERPCSAPLACSARGVVNVCLAPDGVACSDGDECVSRFCPSALGACAPNECFIIGAQDCIEPTLFCAGGACGRTCEPLATRGEECARATSDVDECAFFRACEPDLFCAQFLFAPNILGQCVPNTNRAPGEPCEEDDDCASLSCDSNENACL